MKIFEGIVFFHSHWSQLQDGKYGIHSLSGFWCASLALCASGIDIDIDLGDVGEIGKLAVGYDIGQNFNKFTYTVNYSHIQ